MMRAVMPSLYRALANFSSFAASVAASPDTVTRLTRDVVPPVISTLRSGTPRDLASNATSASLAAFSCGAARTRLQHGAAIAHRLDTVDRVAPTFGREPHVDADTVRRGTPGRHLRSRWDKCNRE